jgi:hypothetical protein
MMMFYILTNEVTMGYNDIRVSDGNHPAAMPIYSQLQGR